MPDSRGSIGAAVLVALVGATAPAQNEFFVGATPIAELNMAGFSSFSPTLSEDELYMVFASDRPGGLGAHDLYETSRPTVDSLWGPPQNLVQLNSAGADYEPNLSYDGLELYFVSTRAGGLGNSDIYVSQRPAVGAPWGPPQNLGAPVNGAGIANDDPALTQDGLTMFYTGPGAGGADVLRTQRANLGAPWGPPQPFAPANSAAFDHSPIPDGNGEVVWFSSTRAGGPLGSSDFYMVAGDPVTNTYSAPVPIADVGSTDWDSNGWHGGRTGRFYVSQFVGPVSSLWRVCPRLKTIWVERCLFDLILHIQLFPPRIWWERVWRRSILVPITRLEWYTWWNWPNGGFCFLFASVATQPGIPGAAFLPGGEGTLILDPNLLFNVQTVAHLPGAQAGMESYNFVVPPNPAFIGGRVNFQEVSLEFTTFALKISEAATIQLTP